MRATDTAGLRLRRGVEGHAGAARRQGRERGRDDAGAREGAGARRLHDHHRGLRCVHGVRWTSRTGSRTRSPRRSARLEEQAGKRLGDPERSAARVGAQRRARVDAGDARHGPEPRPERRLGRGARRRPLRLGLVPALRADVRERVPRHPGRALRGADQGAQGRGRGEGGRGARRRRPEGAHARLPADLPRRDRRGLPAGAARAAAAGDRGRVRLVDGRARGAVPAHQRDPGRVGHGGERAADGLREPRRSLVQRRGVLARRDHRRAQAVRRLPPERPGRGRGVRACAPRATCTR